MKHYASADADRRGSAQGILKHLTVLFLLLFFAVALFDSANAQSHVNVCQADLLFLANRVRVKAVLHGGSLVIVDDANPSSSFTIDRGNILRLSEQSGFFTINTRRPVLYRARESMQFDFQFYSGNYSSFLPGTIPGTIPGNCSSVTAWLRNSLGTRRTYRVGPTRVYWAKLKRGFSRDLEGKLEILDRTIAFIPNRSSEYSHRFELKAINSIERKAPYELEITMSNDDKYKFELQNRAISPEEVNAIRERIARQRLYNNRYNYRFGRY